jgi:alkaline phosphatase D
VPDPLKIAFTSCCDAVRDPQQAAWGAMADLDPDHIVLLGDNVYMDYGLGDHIPNGRALRLSLAEFSQVMHAYYTQQWAVKSFRAALAGSTVHAIWDDHDLGCDNGRCVEPDLYPPPRPGDEIPTDSRYVPPAYRQCARILFAQFRQVLQDKPAHYPTNPLPDGIAHQDLGSIAQTIDIVPGLVRLHLTDGRTFRPMKGHDRSMLGEAQRHALQNALLPEPGINLIASGTTLKDWKTYYPDYVWLRKQAETHRILVLSGDIHEPDFRVRGRLFEATASAMAQPAGITSIVGKKSEVFALLTIDDTSLTLNWWVEGQPSAADTQRISREHWQLLT